MAAETLALAGKRVAIYDAMPSPGRKFLRAGIGGLNITHGEDYESFCSRYGERRSQLQPLLDRFTPEALRAWVHDLGIETFVGTSGRVFPKGMKSAPLLRAWLHRLRSIEVQIHVRHRWLGWNADGSLRLANPEGEVAIRPCATILALGGASWPQLGSDAAWVPWLRARGVEVADFQSANCGFDVAWSDYLREKYAGTPLKAVALSFTDTQGCTERLQGELVISRHGVEGSLIYAHAAALRDRIAADGRAVLSLDLVPGRAGERLARDLARFDAKTSFANRLRKGAGLSGVKAALVRECVGDAPARDPAALAALLKALPLSLERARAIAEAISVAGGIRLSALDENYMIGALPGVFAAGEMLDWEAPTGGYLLTACLATGRAAARGVEDWLKRS